MTYLVECPVCSHTETFTIKPAGLSKCKGCNSLYAPRVVDPNKKKTASPFTIEFSDSEEESRIEEEKEDTPMVEKTKDKRFILEFSDDETDNEENTPPVKRVSRAKNRVFQPMSSDEDEILTPRKKLVQRAPIDSDSDEYTPPKKGLKNNIISDSDSDEYTPTKKNKDYLESEDEDFLPSPKKVVKNNEPKITSDKERIAVVDYDNDPLFAVNFVPPRNEEEENENTNNKEKDKDFQPGDTLFSDEDDSMDEEFIVKEKPVKKPKKKKEPRKKKTGIFNAINGENMPTEEERVDGTIEVYTKGGGAVKKDRNLPVKNTRGTYRFAPKPGNKYNPYILFSKEYRSKLKKANPDISNSELNTLLGKTYRELDPEKKEILIANARKLADQEKAKYVKEDRQKLPPNAYQLFKTMNKDKIKNESDITNVSNYLAKLWNNLPQDEKQMYIDEAASRRQEFMLNNPLTYKEIEEAAKERRNRNRRLKQNML